MVIIIHKSLYDKTRQPISVAPTESISNAASAIETTRTNVLFISKIHLSFQ